MNRNAKTAARAVANGTATKAQSQDFRAAALALGWQGARGLGVVNHTSNERVQSFRLLAQFLLEEAGDHEAAMDRAEEAEMAEMAQDEADREARWAESQAANLAEAEAARTENEAPGGIYSPEAAPVTVVLYRTQTPTIQLSEGTAVDAVITEEILGVTEGLCESGASLECSLEDPSMGLLRTLPESMLPGQERTVMLQCLPCYEASAEAYVRKLHRATA
jgi:hypothetical protein